MDIGVYLQLGIHYNTIMGRNGQLRIRIIKLLKVVVIYILQLIGLEDAILQIHLDNMEIPIMAKELIGKLSKVTMYRLTKLNS